MENQTWDFLLILFYIFSFYSSSFFQFRLKNLSSIPFILLCSPVFDLTCLSCYFIFFVVVRHFFFPREIFLLLLLMTFFRCVHSMLVFYLFHLWCFLLLILSLHFRLFLYLIINNTFTYYYCLDFSPLRLGLQCSSPFGHIRSSLRRVGYIWTNFTFLHWGPCSSKQYHYFISLRDL